MQTHNDQNCIGLSGRLMNVIKLSRVPLRRVIGNFRPGAKALPCLLGQSGLVLLLLTVAVGAQAANWAWSTSPVTANFSGANWTSGSVPGSADSTPVSGDSLYFGTSSLFSLTNDAVDFTFGSLTFNSDAGAFTLAGNAFSLSGGITNRSSSAQVIDNPVTLLASIVVDNAGLITLNGELGGAGNFGLTKRGVGRLTISAPNTAVAGGTTINVGAIQLTGNGQLPPGTITIPGSGTANNVLELAGLNDPLTRGITLSSSRSSPYNPHILNVSGDNTINGSITLIAAGGSGLILGSDAGKLTLTGTIRHSFNNALKTYFFRGSGDFEVSGTGTIGQSSAAAPSNVDKDGSGTLTLGSANSFSAGLILRAGALNINHEAALGSTAAPGGIFTILGGAIDNTSGGDITVVNNNPQKWDGDFTFTGTANLDLGYGAVTLTNNRTVTISANTLTVGGGISGTSHGLIKAGAGTLTLAGVNTYSGNTTISQGTLALGSSGLLMDTPTLFIAAGATYDVSAIGSYALSASTTLSASGTGTTVGISAAAINAGSAGTVNLGNQPMILTYDGSHPALYLAQGTLALYGNLFTVNAAAPLAAGTYTLIEQASGNILSSGAHGVTGTAIGSGSMGSISVSGGKVILEILNVAATKISVETAADGSGTLVPAQSLAAGSSLTLYAIARTADNAFAANVSANWSMPTMTSGVASGDLVPSADAKSATFTGGLLGTAVVKADANGWTATPSGTLTVVHGPATQVRVETAADGSGTVVPGQALALSQTLSVYAITRDAFDNFVANAAADSWTLADATGGMTDSDLSPASGATSTLTAHAGGTSRIRALISGLSSVDSGLITTSRIWSAAPQNYQWDTTSANWVGGTYKDGEPVEFTDAGSASSPIALVNTLTPGSVTVNISSKNYTFGGAGRISGSTGISKQGPGALIFNNATVNDYTGPLTLDGGMVQIGSNNASGSLGMGDVQVTGADTTLAFNRTDSIEVNNTIGGTTSSQPN